MKRLLLALMFPLLFIYPSKVQAQTESDAVEVCYTEVAKVKKNDKIGRYKEDGNCFLFYNNGIAHVADEDTTHYEIVFYIRATMADNIPVMMVALQRDEGSEEPVSYTMIIHMADWGYPDFIILRKNGGKGISCRS